MAENTNLERTGSQDQERSDATKEEVLRLQERLQHRDRRRERNESRKARWAQTVQSQTGQARIVYKGVEAQGMNAIEGNSVLGAQSSQDKAKSKDQASTASPPRKSAEDVGLPKDTPVPEMQASTTPPLTESEGDVKSPKNEAQPKRQRSPKPPLIGSSGLNSDVSQQIKNELLRSIYSSCPSQESSIHAGQADDGDPPIRQRLMISERLYDGVVNVKNALSFLARSLVRIVTMCLPLLWFVFPTILVILVLVLLLYLLSPNLFFFLFNIVLGLIFISFKVIQLVFSFSSSLTAVRGRVLDRSLTAVHVIWDQIDRVVSSPPGVTLWQAATWIKHTSPWVFAAIKTRAFLAHVSSTASVAYAWCLSFEFVAHLFEAAKSHHSRVSRWIRCSNHELAGIATQISTIKLPKILPKKLFSVWIIAYALSATKNGSLDLACSASHRLGMQSEVCGLRQQSLHPPPPIPATLPTTMSAIVNVSVHQQDLLRTTHVFSVARKNIYNIQNLVDLVDLPSKKDFTRVVDGLLPLWLETEQHLWSLKSAYAVSLDSSIIFTNAALRYLREILANLHRSRTRIWFEKLTNTYYPNLASRIRPVYREYIADLQATIAKVLKQHAYVLKDLTRIGEVLYAVDLFSGSDRTALERQQARLVQADQAGFWRKLVPWTSNHDSSDEMDGVVSALNSLQLLHRWYNETIFEVDTTTEALNHARVSLTFVQSRVDQPVRTYEAYQEVWATTETIRNIEASLHVAMAVQQKYLRSLDQYGKMLKEATYKDGEMVYDHPEGWGGFREK